MKRLTPEALEALAFAKGRVIEVDNAAGIAVLTIGGQVFYADLAQAAS